MLPAADTRWFHRLCCVACVQEAPRGAIQVPPDSDPVMLLADHPTTGGYPVIAVVHPDDVAAVAQTPPGGTLRFTTRGV